MSERFSTTYVYSTESPPWSIDQTRDDSKKMHLQNGADIKLWFEVPINGGIQTYGEIIGVVNNSGTETKTNIRYGIQSRLEKSYNRGRPTVLVDSR